MTRADVINWLDTYKHIKEERAEILELIGELEGEREGSQLRSPQLDGMPRSGRISDPTAISAARFAELMENYETSSAVLYDLMMDIESKISALDNPQQRLMLREHYICCLEWEDVALKHNYSVSRCTQIAAEGITELCEVLANA